MSWQNILFVSLSTRYPLGVPRHSALNASSVLWDLQSFYPSLFPQLFIRAFPWGQIWHLWKGVEVSIPTVAFFFLNNSSYIPCIFHVISTFIIFFVSNFKVLAIMSCFLYQLLSLKLSDFNLLQVKKADYQSNYKLE